MGEEKKETPVKTEVSKKCSQGCNFISTDAVDRFCGFCGEKLINC